jgi:hypothetical protein
MRVEIGSSGKVTNVTITVTWRWTWEMFRWNQNFVGN